MRSLQKVLKELQQISYLYKQKKETFKARAFSKATEELASYTGSLKDEKALLQIPGVGKSIVKTIQEILKGDHHKLQKLEKDAPPATLEELEILPGVGPVGAKKLYEETGASSWKALLKLYKDKKLKDKNLAANVRDAIQNSKRIPLFMSLEIVEPFLEAVRAMPNVTQAKVAGSVRRRKSTVKDLDIVIAIKKVHREKLIASFQKQFKVLIQGTHKVRLQTPASTNIKRTLDLVLTEPKSFGNAMNYFTGSTEFNIAMRILAKQKGYTVNEHFTVRLKDKKKMPSANEKDLFKLLKIPYVPPQCRTGSDAVGKDFKNRLKVKDIKGQLHNHTTFSDGKYSVKEVTALAQKEGLEFFAVSDHSSSMGMIGMKEKRVKKYLQEVKQAQKQNKNLKVYASVECDVNGKGTLDYSLKTLKSFDFLLLATHIQPAKNITKRLLTAFQFCRKNKLKAILTHPTGRLLGVGKGYRAAAQADWNKIFKRCVEQGIPIEINAQPSRMDLDVGLIQQARQANCQFVINADSHNGKFDNTKYGVWLAQSAGLSKKETINSNHLKFKKWITI